MLNAVLAKKSLGVRITVKGAISVLLVVLAVMLPQIAHIAGGAAAGSVWLPMYAPALLAGCLLGWQWGLGVGVLSPVISFGFTTLALGAAMPALSRLPVMTAELAVFGLVAGAFARKIEKNAFWAFPAVIVAQVGGRLVNFIGSLIAGQSVQAAWSVIQTGMFGLYLQAAIVPLLVVVSALVIRNDRD